MRGRVKSLNVSNKKGVRKGPAPSVILIKGLGIEGDIHAAGGLRQVSLLSGERIQDCSLRPGDFAENITTEGLDLSILKTGDLLNVGKIRLKVSKIGKECHTRCEIFKKIGDCIMPREGIFAEVLEGGEIKVGDNIEVIND